MVNLHGLEGLGFTVSTPNKYRRKPKFGATQVSNSACKFGTKLSASKLGHSTCAPQGDIGSSR